jgi:hypothetical protein
MRVLTIKPDKMLNPFRAKSQIVVLGNHEDCIWSKSEWYAPNLCSNTMHFILSLTLESNKEIVRMHFVRASSLLMRLRLSSHPLEIPKPPKMNTGSSSTHCMGFATVHIIEDQNHSQLAGSSSKCLQSMSLHWICY